MVFFYFELNFTPMADIMYVFWNCPDFLEIVRTLQKHPILYNIENSTSKIFR